MKKNIIDKLKRKKIFMDNENKIIDLYYVENDFYYSIIYHPKKQRWEPIKNSSSLESVCLPSNQMEEPGLFMLLRTSLQPHRELYEIVQNKEYEHPLDNEIINRSELKIKK